MPTDTVGLSGTNILSGLTYPTSDGSKWSSSRNRWLRKLIFSSISAVVMHLVLYQ